MPEEFQPDIALFDHRTLDIATATSYGYGYGYGYGCGRVDELCP